MKKKLLILLIILSTSITLFSQTNDKSQNALKILGYKGKVKSCKETLFHTDSIFNRLEKSILKSSVTYEFNQDGNLEEIIYYHPKDTTSKYPDKSSRRIFMSDKDKLLKVTYFNDKDIITNRFIYTYDEKGNKKEELVYDKDSLIQTNVANNVYYKNGEMKELTLITYMYNREYDKSFRKYDIRGNIIEEYSNMMHFSGTHELYKYDSKDRMIECTLLNDGKEVGMKKFTYVKKDNVIKEVTYCDGKIESTISTTYDKRGNIIETSNDGHVTKNSYNNKYQLVKKENLNRDVITNTTIYIYDKKGNTISEVDKSSSTYRKYDKYGNWISKILKTIYGTTITEREIEYR